MKTGGGGMECVEDGAGGVARTSAKAGMERRHLARGPNCSTPKAVSFSRLILMHKSCRKHVLLASEVFFYFFLAILDVITHTVPNVGHSLDMFKALDIFLGEQFRLSSIEKITNIS